MPGGRPLKFKTPQELQEKIDAYFASCWGKKIGQFGPIKDPETKQFVMGIIKPYTISGLASFLDTSRETLLNYEERDEFFDAIKAAKAKCEAYAEEMLFTGKQAAGPIFNLKNNYGHWKDKTETDITSDGLPIQPIIGMRIIDESRNGNKPIKIGLSPREGTELDAPKEKGVEGPASRLPKQEPKANPSS